MATNWIVSTHAAVYEDTGKRASAGQKVIKLVPVPEGVTIHFFVPERIGLLVSTAWTAYKYLMNSPPQFNQLANIGDYKVFTGRSVPNYSIVGDTSWVDTNGQLASGIFIAGDTHHRDPRTRYIGNSDWLSIEQFFNGRMWQIGDNIFWLACRVWQ